MTWQGIEKARNDLTRKNYSRKEFGKEWKRQGIHLARKNYSRKEFGKEWKRQGIHLARNGKGKEYIWQGKLKARKEFGKNNLVIP